MSVILVHALLATAAAQLLALLVGDKGPEGARIVLAALAPGAYLLFGLGVSGGLHKNRFVLLGAASIVLIAIFPNLQGLPIYLVPIAGGAVLGRCLRSVIKSDDAPAPPQVLPAEIVQVPHFPPGGQLRPRPQLRAQAHREEEP